MMLATLLCAIFNHRYSPWRFATEEYDSRECLRCDLSAWRRPP